MMNRLSIVSAAALILAMAASAPVFARSFPLAPNQTAVGDVGHYTTRYEDTLLDVARGNDLGYTQLITANRGIDPWLPGKGHRIAVPQFYILPDGPRRGIVINLAEQRLFYFPPGGQTVETFPIGVGVQGWVTPLGATRIVDKQTHPAWYPPASIRAEKPELPNYVAPGPDNPLGDYAMRLGWRSYLLHGTNKPFGVGRNVSHGCVRLYPEDIDHLFHEVSVGTPVRVINQEVEAAWIDNQLYVAVFPNKTQTDQIDVEEKMTPVLPTNLLARVKAVAGEQANRVDWDRVKQVGMERTGMPTLVTPMAVAAREGSDAAAPPNADGDAPDQTPAATGPASESDPALSPDTQTYPDSGEPGPEAQADPNRDAADQNANNDAVTTDGAPSDLATINRVIENFPAK